MKTILTLALCSALVLFSSCKKMFLNSEGSDIAAGVKQGYQYNTWIIDDDNADHHDQTQNTNTFKDKKDPKFLIKKDNTYTLTYASAQSTQLTSEAGNYNIDATAKTITFHPSGKPDYTYKITCLTQENFTWIAISDQTIMVKNKEGVLVPQEMHTQETLYMEDND